MNVIIFFGLGCVFMCFCNYYVWFECVFIDCGVIDDVCLMMFLMLDADVCC